MATLLYRRLEEAMQNGSEVRIRLANTSFMGVPIQLDHDFVELLNLFVDDDDDASLCERSVWLIKLTEIVAFSYPIESWSKSRLENLMKDPAQDSIQDSSKDSDKDPGKDAGKDPTTDSAQDPEQDPEKDSEAGSETPSIPLAESEAEPEHPKSSD